MMNLSKTQKPCFFYSKRIASHSRRQFIDQYQKQEQRRLVKKYGTQLRVAAKRNAHLK